MNSNSNTHSYADPRIPEIAEDIVNQEWKQFQLVNNEGGRANCQGNWPTFHIMRLSQFLTWNYDLLESYREDLNSGRNLLMEKYAWMMQSTEPDYFHKDLEPYLLRISNARHQQQERIINMQLVWALDFHKHYPHLGDNMRVLHTADDTKETTSFETYLRGELSTYSDKTLDLYDQFITLKASEEVNLTEEIITWTVRLNGYDSIESAESYLSI
ncbi:DUF4125 family protein [Alloscardovia theropitheci]|uniref:DUF4125 family protein n=1 Tax=Alloscardovia theropitheci TaxID=2496842 RepID=A0A4R0QQH4_9BIFI|nr:DUF4125 family protein [Alloscardovia theropitheci]TCD54572.1 DUF4125 family protein [Alloscardovia theropitheci]